MTVTMDDLEKFGFRLREHLENYDRLYHIADRVLTLLRGHPIGPPGIKGIQESLYAVSQDNLDDWKKVKAMPGPANLYPILEADEKWGALCRGSNQ